MSYDVITLPVRVDGAQLYEINGVVMRRMTMPEFIAFTGFNSYDLQRPDTQPLKYNWILEGDPSCDPIMNIGGRPVHKIHRDLRGRRLVNIEVRQCFTDDFCHRVRCNDPLRNACGQHGNNAITIQYPDGMIWHHDGGIYVPVTEAELQDPEVLAKCRPLTQKDIELALMHLRGQEDGGRTS
jgi:hypothetical protein